MEYIYKPYSGTILDRRIIIEPPPGQIITKVIAGGNLRVQIKWNEPMLIKKREKFKRAQQLLDTAIIKDTDPYVPFLSGTLSRSVDFGTVIGSGLIHYVAPYARNAYYRPAMPYLEKHPLASRQWFEVSKKANERKWLDLVKKTLQD